MKNEGCSHCSTAPLINRFPLKIFRTEPVCLNSLNPTDVQTCTHVHGPTIKGKCIKQEPGGRRPKLQQSILQEDCVRPLKTSRTSVRRDPNLILQGPNKEQHLQKDTSCLWAAYLNVAAGLMHSGGLIKTLSEFLQYRNGDGADRFHQSLLTSQLPAVWDKSASQPAALSLTYFHTQSVE